MSRCILLLSVLGVVPLATGCGSSGGQPVVSGTVSFDDQPLADGAILFFPIEGKTGPEGGNIKDGRYRVSVHPGRKRVEIRATRLNPKKRGPMGEQGWPENYIPARYNEQSSLVVEVTAAGESHFDFSLQSEAK